ncbi:MAG: energy transducer TonB [Vicinamibacterales bacterium]
MALIVNAAAPIAQQQASQSETQWPPAGVAALDGSMTPPRVLEQVKPQYPREAMRRSVQGVVVLGCVVEQDGSVGAVRVLQSLDPDLDAEAVAAVKQWRFEPARSRDGSAVAVAIKTELRFTIRNGPAPPPTLAWPQGFESAPNDRDEAWIDRTANTADLTIHVSHPVDWAYEPFGDGRTAHMSVRNISGTEAVSIQRPGPEGPFNAPMPDDSLQRFVDWIQQRQQAEGRPIHVAAYGQVAFAGATWLWTDAHASTADMPLPPRASRAISDVRMWVFVANLDHHLVMITCALLVPSNATPEQRDAQLLQATADFGEIVRRLAIAPR